MFDFDNIKEDNNIIDKNIDVVLEKRIRISLYFYNNYESFNDFYYEFLLCFPLNEKLIFNVISNKVICIYYDIYTAIDDEINFNVLKNIIQREDDVFDDTLLRLKRHNFIQKFLQLICVDGYNVENDINKTLFLDFISASALKYIRISNLNISLVKIDVCNEEQPPFKSYNYNEFVLFNTYSIDVSNSNITKFILKNNCWPYREVVKHNVRNSKYF